MANLTGIVAWVFGSGIVISLVIVLMMALPLLVRWFGRNRVFGVRLAILLGMLFGWVGGDLGLSDLFWHVSGYVQFAAGISIASLATLLFFLSFLSADDQSDLAARAERALNGPIALLRRLRHRPRPGCVASEDAARQLRVYLEAMNLPLLLILALPLAVALRDGKIDGTRLLPLGAALMFLAIDLPLRFIRVARWRCWHGLTAVLAPIVVLNLISLAGAERAITAVMAIALLMAEIALVIFLTHGRPLLRLGLLLVVLLVAAFTNSDPYKLSYPMGKDYYRDRIGIVPITLDHKVWRVKSPGEKPYNDGLKKYERWSGQLDERWSGQLDDAVASELEKAWDLMNEALDCNPRYLRAYRIRACLNEILGRICFERKQLDPARRFFRAMNKDANQAIMECGDQSKCTWVLLGESYEHLDDYRSAIDSYSKAVEGDHLDVRARAHRAGAMKKAAELMPPGPERDAQMGHAAEELRQAASDQAELVKLGFGKQDGGVGRADFDARGDRPAQGGRREDDIKDWTEALSANPGLGYPGVKLKAESALLNDDDALMHWCMCISRLGPPTARRPETKPKLVVVAVSGGGIVAAAWTLRCLAKIEGRIPDFPYHVRIVTGASGGMVGAGHYVATLPLPPHQRSPQELKRICDQIDADSLTPVVCQMVLRDLPSIFCPKRQSQDRGRVLERVWDENTGGALATTFRELRKNELMGLRPSLIISPLVVEDGAQMVISNLDLETLRDINMHFFATFPESQDTLKLSTALRMNAAFPYVTPASSLPTDPPRRVADAGYVDNYGVRIAAQWLKKNQNFILRNTSGVALVQIRAYPFGLPEYESGPEGETSACAAGLPRAPHKPDLASKIATSLQQFASKIATSLQFLSTPLEGYMTANKAAMIAHNDSMIETVKDALSKDEHGSNFLRTFVFECNVDVPLSWFITQANCSRLDKAIKSNDVKLVLDQLHQFLCERPAVSTGAAGRVHPPADTIGSRQ